jgi:hypothetical protein
MQSFSEGIWFLAYLVQMLCLAVGVGLVSVLVIAALWEATRGKLGESRHQELTDLAGSEVRSGTGSTVHWHL